MILLYAEEMKFNKALQESRKAYSSNEDAFKSYLKAVQKGKKPSAEAIKVSVRLPLSSYIF